MDPIHNGEVPVTELIAAVGITVTGNVEIAPAVHGGLIPCTVTFPEVALPEKLTVIELVPAPDAKVAPGGKVHVYPVAFAIRATL